MIESDIDDISLLKQIGDRDQTAISQLYDRYARLIYTIAYKILGSQEESEEVVIDVFNQVWRSALSYSPTKARVDTWMFMITRSRALDKLRRLKRNAKVNLACTNAVMERKHTPLPEENLLVLEKCDRLKVALNQLPDAQRQALELAYYNGLTHAQIAEATGKSLGTIKTRIRLGLAKLKAILEPEL